MVPIKKPKVDEFKKSLGFSLGLHISIILIFLVKFAFFSKPIIDISQAISVSIGDVPLKDTNKLPPKIQAAQPQEPVKESTIEETPQDKIEKINEMAKAPDKPKPDEINLNKTIAKQKDALSKLKKLSALDKIKQELKADSISKIKNQDKKAAANGPQKPRIIAAGSALGGLDKLQANSYLQEVDRNIKENWSLPQWLINKPLKAQALVKFNMQGQILSSMIISSSGNASYDQYCLQAIAKAAPFPSVPDKLSEKFRVDGIVVGFPE
ncbi:MAG: TonB C-terminal domain-containing protein [Pseudobdellovibrio sp.]